MNRRDPVVVLVAGFDAAAGQRRVETLQAAGFRAEFLPVAADLAERVGRAECDAVLLEAAGARGPECVVAACRALSDLDIDRKVPVLACHDMNDRKTVIEAFDAGVSDFVAPSIDLEELAARLRAHARIQRERKAMRRATIRDVLTGLFNRVYFEDRLREELSRIERYGGDLGVLLIDLDNFKQINDGFGHAVGDAALQGTGEIISRTVRKTDLVARFGGDEFALLLLGIETAHPGVVAERIRAAVESESADFASRVPPFTASIGATALGTRKRPVETLLAEADHALYASKRAGRNRATLWGAESDSNRTDRVDRDEVPRS